MIQGGLVQEGASQKLLPSLLPLLMKHANIFIENITKLITNYTLIIVSLFILLKWNIHWLIKVKVDWGSIWTSPKYGIG